MHSILHQNYFIYNLPGPYVTESKQTATVKVLFNSIETSPPLQGHEHHTYLYKANIPQ